MRFATRRRATRTAVTATTPVAQPNKGLGLLGVTRHVNFLTQSLGIKYKEKLGIPSLTPLPPIKLYNKTEVERRNWGLPPHERLPTTAWYHWALKNVGVCVDPEMTPTEQYYFSVFAVIHELSHWAFNYCPQWNGAETAVHCVVHNLVTDAANEQRLMVLPKRSPTDTDKRAKWFRFYVKKGRAIMWRQTLKAFGQKGSLAQGVPLYEAGYLSLAIHTYLCVNGHKIVARIYEEDSDLTAMDVWEAVRAKMGGIDVHPCIKDVWPRAWELLFECWKTKNEFIRLDLINEFVRLFPPPAMPAPPTTLDAGDHLGQDKGGASKPVLGRPLDEQKREAEKQRAEKTTDGARQPQDSDGQSQSEPAPGGKEGGGEGQSKADKGRGQSDSKKEGEQKGNGRKEDGDDAQAGDGEGGEKEGGGKDAAEGAGDEPGEPSEPDQGAGDESGEDQGGDDGSGKADSGDGAESGSEGGDGDDSGDGGGDGNSSDDQAGSKDDAGDEGGDGGGGGDNSSDGDGGDPKAGSDGSPKGDSSGGSPDPGKKGGAEGDKPSRGDSPGGDGSGQPSSGTGGGQGDRPAPTGDGQTGGQPQQAPRRPRKPIEFDDEGDPADDTSDRGPEGEEDKAIQEEVNDIQQPSNRWAPGIGPANPHEEERIVPQDGTPLFEAVETRSRTLTRAFKVAKVPRFSPPSDVCGELDIEEIARDSKTDYPFLERQTPVKGIPPNEIYAGLILDTSGSMKHNNKAGVPKGVAARQFAMTFHRAAVTAKVTHGIVTSRTGELLAGELDPRVRVSNDRARHLLGGFKIMADGGDNYVATLEPFVIAIESRKEPIKMGVVLTDGAPGGRERLREIVQPRQKHMAILGVIIDAENEGAIECMYYIFGKENTVVASSANVEEVCGVFFPSAVKRAAKRARVR